MGQERLARAGGEKWRSRSRSFLFVAARPRGRCFPGGVQKEIDVPGQLTLTGHHDLALHGAVAGHGIALVAEHIARPYLQQAMLVRLLDDWTPPFPGLALFYPPGRPMTAALRALFEHAKAPEHWPR